jgi:hypothetical protein
MHSWNPPTKALRRVTLAADARLCTPDYCDDQIWQLSLAGGEPPALALETTFGLRARGLRLFPRFSEGDVTVNDPEQFANPPVIIRLYPNFLSARFSPFTDIDVEADYWVPQSQSVAGRLRITNQSRFLRQIRLDWVTLLTPIEQGQRMAALEIQATTVICGRSADLSPLVFLTGGPSVASGPYPALTLEFDLPANRSRQVTWSHAARRTPEDSFALAREIVTANWDAERAQIEMTNAGQIEIITGDPEWDLAFALATKDALGLFMGPTSNLPHPSFVNSRQPDQGYSMRGDGSDYGYLWNGQSLLEAYYILDYILPGYPELAKGILYNFLYTQDQNGFVDWKPGLGGQRSNQLATPLLAGIALRIYEITEEKHFLEEVYPRLLKFFLAWFEPERDRDGDGIPEWDHPMQAGFDDHPIFARWHSWAEGVDISTAESPSLCAFLHRECKSLIRIGAIIDHPEIEPSLKMYLENLRIASESSWDPKTSSYHYRDRDTHYTSEGGRVGERWGSGELPTRHKFDWPVRLLVRVKASGETTRRPKIFFHGLSASGNHRVERLSLERFQWYMGWGTATSEYTYAVLENVEIQGLEDDDQIIVESVRLADMDHTLLLPLWSGIPSERHAQILVNQTVTSPSLFWRSFGLPACPMASNRPEAGICQSVHTIWNRLIGEGMLDYGYQMEAGELLGRIMKAMTKSIKETGSFFRYYNAETGEGIGERDALGGLAPIGLFLSALGVHLISSYKVFITGFNPFPWPVTVKYRGLTVLRQLDGTQITFPDGQTISVKDPNPQIITLE